MDDNAIKTDNIEIVPLKELNIDNLQHFDYDYYGELYGLYKMGLISSNSAPTAKGLKWLADFGKNLDNNEKIVDLLLHIYLLHKFAKEGNISDAIDVGYNINERCGKELIVLRKWITTDGKRIEILCAPWFEHAISDLIPVSTFVDGSYEPDEVAEVDYVLNVVKYIKTIKEMTPEERAWCEEIYRY